MKRRKSMRGGSGGLTRDMYDQVMENPDIRSIIDAHLRAAERANPIAARVAHRPARVHERLAPEEHPPPPPPPPEPEPEPEPEPLQTHKQPYVFLYPFEVNNYNVTDISNGDEQTSGRPFSKGGIFALSSEVNVSGATLSLFDIEGHIKRHFGIDFENDIDIYYDNGQNWVKLEKKSDLGSFMESNCLYDSGEGNVINLKLAPAGANVDPLRGDVIES